MRKKDFRFFLCMYMYWYVYMYVCMYVFVYVYMYVCMYTWTGTLQMLEFKATLYSMQPFQS
jgi:hypothetical protein